MEKDLGKYECPELVLCRLLRTAVLFHIWSTPLNVLLSCLSPDVLYLGEIDRPSCKMGKYLAANFPP